MNNSVPGQAECGVLCVCVCTDKSQPWIPAFKSALQEFGLVLAELSGNSAWGGKTQNPRIAFDFIQADF